MSIQAMPTRAKDGPVLSKQTEYSNGLFEVKLVEAIALKQRLERKVCTAVEGGGGGRAACPQPAEAGCRRACSGRSSRATASSSRRDMGAGLLSTRVRVFEGRA